MSADTSVSAPTTGRGVVRWSRTRFFYNPGALQGTAWMLFLIIPAVVLALYLVAVPYELTNAQNLYFNAVRGAFVAALTVLPAFLFYLHAATRRESAFNSFASALNRLGLLNRLFVLDGTVQESEHTRTTRIHGYIDRFAATYGAPPRAIETRLSTSTDLSWSTEGGEGLGTFFQSRTLLAPMAVTFVVLLGWLLALPPISKPPYLTDGGAVDWSGLYRPEQTTAGIAFLGAYVFCLEMLRRRFMLRDITGNLYVGILIRFLFSMLLAAVLVQIMDQISGQAGTIATRLNSTTDLLIAFGVGAMPMLYVSFLFKLAQKATGISLSKNDMPLRYMDGIDIWQEARLDEEDIEDIENLACANLVYLIIGTRYSPDRLVDWVDQAILYCALGPQPEDADDKAQPDLRAKLRRYAVRTSTDLIDNLAAESATFPFPACLGDEEAKRVRTLAVTIKNHPNFPLVRNWRWDSHQNPAHGVSAASANAGNDAATIETVPGNDDPAAAAMIKDADAAAGAGTDTVPGAGPGDTPAGGQGQ